MKQPLNFTLLFRLAWRDSRRNRGRLLLFISSIIVGIAALVAINSFSENLQKDINGQARQLLGADLAVNGLTPPTRSVKKALDSISGEQTQLVSFLSMAFFPKSEGTRPVNVKAVRGEYPFYGTLQTEPVVAATTFQKERKALVDNTLRIQFGLNIGDSVRIGERGYEISGYIISAPGRAGIGASIAPIVFLPLNDLDSVNLLQRGSRVEYSFLYKLSDKANSEALVKSLKPTLDTEKYGIETVSDRKRSTGNSFSQLTDFLNLVGFIALLLGCIGVASAVNIYVKDKLPTVAILRTLGASGQQAFWVYLIQIATMGLGGAIIGALLGTGIQWLLPIILKDFLPVENVSSDPSVTAIIQGVVTGFAVAVSFALLPLLTIRKISPLRVLRSSFEEAESGRDLLRYVIFGLIVFFIFGFTYSQTRSVKNSLIFIAGVATALALLAGVAWLFMRVLRSKILRGSSFAMRQSVANLYRPQNQTMTLVVSIGLGTMLIATLFLTQNLLLKQISFAGSGTQPNMILFDIQPQQRDSVAELVAAQQMPLIQQVPVVTIRLEEMDGISRSQFLKDSTSDIPKWVYEREYRVTYRDTLIESEKMLKGELPKTANRTGTNQPPKTQQLDVLPALKLPDGSIGVTIASSIARNMKAKVGTKLLWNVQGALVQTTVTGIREVDFGRVQTNFLVLFPSGILEKAPQFHVVISRVTSAEQSAKFQATLIKTFPNISVIDLTQILKTVDAVLTKVSFVIRFMALFSILTGLLVLISSVYLSKFQRIRESVLLRTIGANRRTILTINGLEYLWLGLLATFTGVSLSLIAAWSLSKFVFKVPFNIDWLTLLSTPLSITALVVIIGLINSRRVVSESPLEVLRQEV
ncbi:MAG: FtsX-like permease family protein [Saprospiraceae bacterium]|nr:FtsX-like permease family protein [Saprospiraceae bacterium]